MYAMCAFDVCILCLFSMYLIHVFYVCILCMYSRHIVPEWKDGTDEAISDYFFGEPFRITFLLFNQMNGILRKLCSFGPWLDGCWLRATFLVAFHGIFEIP